MKTNKRCLFCGKQFWVEVRDKDHKILTDCFHSFFSKNIFEGWMYRLNDKKNKNEDWTFTPIFKNKFWKIIGFTKVQREIIYFFWNLFFGWQKIEYWECPKCMKKK